jgi:hypothetical protein
LLTHVDELYDLNIQDLAKDELVQTVREVTRIVGWGLGDEVVVAATA